MAMVKNTAAVRLREKKKARPPPSFLPRRRSPRRHSQALALPLSLSLSLFSHFLWEAKLEKLPNHRGKSEQLTEDTQAHTEGEREREITIYKGPSERQKKEAFYCTALGRPKRKRRERERETRGRG